MGPHIDRADEDRVDTRQGVNLFGIGQADGAFGLQDDQDFVIGMAEVFGAAGVEVQGLHAAPQAAISFGRILGSTNRHLSLFDRVDHRYDDAPRPGVESPLDVEMRPLRHAADRHATGFSNASEHGRSLRPIDRRMLHVQRQPIEARAGHDARGIQIAQRQPGAERRFSGFQRPLDGIGFHGWGGSLEGKFATPLECGGADRTLIVCAGLACCNPLARPGSV